MDLRVVEAANWSIGYNWLEQHPNKLQPGGTGILVTFLLVHGPPGNDWVRLG